MVFIVNFSEYIDQWAGAELVGHGGDLIEPTGFTESSQKADGLRLGTLEGRPFGQDNAPGKDAGEQQKDKDGEGDGAGVADHLEYAGEGAAGGRRGGQRGVVLKKECE